MYIHIQTKIHTNVLNKRKSKEFQYLMHAGASMIILLFFVYGSLILQE
jgi:hypothetical protein